MSDNNINDIDDQSDILFMRSHDLQIPDALPLIGVDNFVLFPFMIAPFIIVKESHKELVNAALRGDRLLGLCLKKDPSAPEIFENIHHVGTAAMIIKMLRMPDGTIRLFIHGIERIKVLGVVSEDPFMKVRAEKFPDIKVESLAVDAMAKNVQSQIMKIVQLGNLPEDFGVAVMGMNDPGKLSDLIASNLSLKIEERQAVLEIPDIEKRLEKVVELVGREMSLLELGTEIQSKVQSKIDKTQRDYLLREQMKAIKKEIGEDEERNPEIAEMQKAIEDAMMPDDIHEVAGKELKRLESMHPSSAEYSVSRTYLDWLVSLPWSKSTDDNMDIVRAGEILDEDHYDLADVKERILEHLSVIKLKRAIRGPILCFVGPPGVGKTSVGQSIARALGRKFYRMSLGGMRDEAEIRGHRRTYIGALPGRVIKGIKDCGSNNPLIMLDEIDKIGTDFRGDPASALLEVLDPAQNHTFVDHYLDVPFDLSKVMFITTANLLDPVPEPLRDRMEVLRLSGYTTREKLEIAKRYLVQRAYDDTGVTKEEVVFTDEGLFSLIEDYTREAGVRNLEREIGSICRKVARRMAQGQEESITIGKKELEEFLGPQRVYHDMVDRMGQIGVAVGLAWTQTGGEILFIEASAVPGNGQLLLTGQLGEVMKESAMAALNFLHSNAQYLNIPGEAFMRQNVHLHVPAGATPKDGPSAGITMAVALCSLMRKVPVKSFLAMTGEITLKGNVLPVGGIKEKVLAAHRSGIKELILPMRVEPELRKSVPEEVLNSIQFHFVDHISQVLAIAFESPGDLKAREEKEKKKEKARIRSAVPLKPASPKHIVRIAGDTATRTVRKAGNPKAGAARGKKKEL